MHFHNFVLLTGFRVAFAVNLEETDAPTRGHALSLTCYSGSCANSDHGKATPSASEVQEAAAFLESQAPEGGDPDPDFSPEVGPRDASVHPAPQGSKLMGWTQVNPSADVVDVFKQEDREILLSELSGSKLLDVVAGSDQSSRLHQHHHDMIGRFEDQKDRPCSDVITDVFFTSCDQFEDWPEHCGDCATNRNANGDARVTLVMSDLKTSCRHICDVCCRAA
jgi:hypothetical protein